MLDDLAGDILTPITDAFKNTLLQNLSQALALVHQASVFDWESLIDSTRDERNPNPMMSLATLANLDNMASERSIGSAAVSA